MANNNDKHFGAFRPYSRHDVTLCIEPHGVFNEGDNPLSAAHESFSRFSFALLKDGKAHLMNMRWFTDDGTEGIKPNNYLAFVNMFNLVKNEHLKKLLVAGNGSQAQKSCYTLVFKNGKFTKGKTAAQVLKEDSDGRKHLEEQRKWLADNVGRYPDNERFITAIDEALALSVDELSKAASTVNYVLYSSGYRLLSTKTNKSDKKLTYNGEIKFYPGIEYPTEVSISNCYCDTKKQGDLVYPDLNTAEEKSSATISLSWNETLRLLKECELYFDIKSNDLYKKGISVSEEGFASNGVNSTEKPAENDNVDKNTSNDTKTQEEAKMKPTEDESTKASKTKDDEAKSESTMRYGEFYNIAEITPYKNTYCTTFSTVPITELEDESPRYNVIFDEQVIKELKEKLEDKNDSIEGVMAHFNDLFINNNESVFFPVIFDTFTKKQKGKDIKIMSIKGFKKNN